MAPRRKSTLTPAERTRMAAQVRLHVVGGKKSKKYKDEEKREEPVLGKRYAYQYPSARYDRRYDWYADVLLDEARYSRDEEGKIIDIAIREDTIFLGSFTRVVIKARIADGRIDARVDEVLGHGNWTYDGLWRLSYGKLATRKERTKGVTATPVVGDQFERHQMLLEEQAKARAKKRKK